jgi:integrase
MSLYQRGKSWYYDFWCKRQRYTGCIGPISKTMAKEIYARKRAEALQGTLGLHATKDPVFKYFAEQYLAHYKVTRWLSSYVRAESEVKQFCRLWGDRRLSQITPRMIEEYKGERLGAGIKPATVERDLGTLQQMYATAILWKQATANPLLKLSRPKAGKGRIRFLTAEEESRLLAVCNQYIKPVVLVALYTGFRKTALRRLTWGDVDFDRGVVRCKPEDDKAKDGYEVPMSNTLRPLLERLRGDRLDPSSPVFLSRRRRAFRYVNGSFTRAVKKAGIPDFRFHDLRHTFASRLVMAGVHLIVVKELMGHHDISMTMRYAHLSSEYRQQAVNLL